MMRRYWVGVGGAMITLALAWCVVGGGGVRARAATPLAGGPATAPSTRPAHAFRSNVKVEVTDDYFIVHSDGIPDHTTGDFPNRFNPNTILRQDYTFRIPRHPVRAEKVTPCPMGPIGVAINGVPFYNPYNAEGQDAAKNEVFDECCGHPDPAGRYHYHIYPRCIHTSFKDPRGEHSPLIGYAFDGYAVYGPNGEGGVPPKDLDECNGHADPARGYHYHVTNKFPYILGGYRGVVDRRGFDPQPGEAGGPPLGAGASPPGNQGGGGPPWPPPFPPPGAGPREREYRVLTQGLSLGDLERTLSEAGEGGWNLRFIDPAGRYAVMERAAR